MNTTAPSSGSAQHHKPLRVPSAQVRHAEAKAPPGSQGCCPGHPRNTPRCQRGAEPRPERAPEAGAWGSAEGCPRERGAEGRRARKGLSGCDIYLQDISPGPPPLSRWGPTPLNVADNPPLPSPLLLPDRVGMLSAGCCSAPSLARRSGRFGLCSGKAGDVCLVPLVTALPAPVITFSLCRPGQELQRGNVEQLRPNTSLGTARVTSHGPSVAAGSYLLRVPSPQGMHQPLGCSNRLTPAFLQQLPKGSVVPVRARDSSTGAELQEELQE